MKSGTKTAMKVEVVFLPVSDVDRARDFYTAKLGWNVDVDHEVNPELRFVQVTPPGSACSFAFGTGISENTPGSCNNVMLVVDDVRSVIDELRANGAEASDADVQMWGTFSTVKDPDGNLFTFQELPDYSQLPDYSTPSS